MTTTVSAVVFVNENQFERLVEAYNLYLATPALGDESHCKVNVLAHAVQTSKRKADNSFFMVILL